LFVLAVLLGLAIELWLGARQAAAVARHRERVPGPFAASISPAEHGKAADYTLARLRLGRFGSLIDAALTLALTVGGGIAAVDALWRHGRLTEPWLGLAVIASVALLVELIHLPLSVWRTFGLEARFGFNRTTPALFLADLGRGLALAVALGAPVLTAILLLMERAVRWWWVWAWGLWLAVMLLMTWAWPAFIAPLFNRFVPLPDLALLLFAFAAPAFTFFVTPLASLWSRRHEFEADDFASRHASAAELASALVKLHRDNASTLTPDALYAAFYYSHPPPLVRITRLRAPAAPQAS